MVAALMTPSSVSVNHRGSSVGDRKVVDEAGTAF